MMHFNYSNNRKEGRKVDLQSCKFKKDMQGYSLDLTYLIETPCEIQKLHIPRLMLPLHGKDVRISVDRQYYSDILYTADIGFGNCRMLLDDQGAAFTIETVETKTKEMTLEEIEKKLGHKVKIVNK